MASAAASAIVTASASASARRTTGLDGALLQCRKLYSRPDETGKKVMSVHAQTLWAKIVAVDSSVQVSQRKAYELRVVSLGSNSLPYSGLACHQHRGRCSGLINGHWHLHLH
jgi:hypothetical protein